MTRDDLILQTLQPVTHDLGGFKVHRTLPSPERRMVGPFIFFDQMGPAHLAVGRGVDVRPHPHIGLSTVTYLFDGAFDHRDTLGTFRTITPGAVNLMTAGRGIAHSERSPEGERARGPLLSGIQTWLALPEALEDSDPAFEHVPAGDLPEIDGGGAVARVIMGTLWGGTAPTTLHSGTIYADIRLDAGGAVPIDDDAEERALYVASGEASLDGLPLDPGRLYVLRPGIRATLRSARGGRVMFAGGDAFATRRHIFWNFVHSDRDRIVQAREDWKAGRFPLIPGDSEERIPLPEPVRPVTYP